MMHGFFGLVEVESYHDLEPRSRPRKWLLFSARWTPARVRFIAPEGYSESLVAPAPTGQLTPVPASPALSTVT